MAEPDPFDIREDAEVTPAGAQRLRNGHLWIYAGDIVRPPSLPAPIVKVCDGAHNTLGYAFYSSDSRIRLRMLSKDAHPPDAAFLKHRLKLSISRRGMHFPEEGARRLVFGEADLLPSVVVDRYADYVVLQTLSRGADSLKGMLVDVLRDLINPKGILERNDVKARLLEGLPEHSGILWGSVPQQVRILEDGIQFWVDLHRGQKTGFFLDQSENRIAAARHSFGHCLDCFTNTGAFALHFARACDSVVGVDVSDDSLALARRNADLNGIRNADFRKGNVFDILRDQERAGKRFDTICLDPPAFAKNRSALPAARGGYKEINLRAMKLLQPEGILVTSSCSYHLPEGDFFVLLGQASRDAHRPIQVLERRTQSSDHPILAGMPETHYLKCFILRVL